MLQKRLASSAWQHGAHRAPSLSACLGLAYALLTLGLSSATPALAGPFTELGWDPSAMVGWASAVDDFVAGPMDVTQPALGVASLGLPENALGPVTTHSSDVVSLGDAGTITLYFAAGIGDGLGDDFAVFENGFFTVGGLFAEFAFVEVSSNGVDFARLPATSLNPFPVASFDPVDPTDYHNLGGAHASGLGTGFDLRGIADNPLVLAGDVDSTDIRYVRLVDVIGDGSTTDDAGAPIYDPYPTAFSSGGFDLDAVGVIHDAPEPHVGLGLSVGAFALLAQQAERRRWGGGD